MATIDAKTIAHRWTELWNANSDLGIVDDLVASDFVSHSAPPGLPGGPAGVKVWVGIFREAFPDLYSAADDVIVEGDRVVERFHAGGTHRGDFFGIPPTGRSGRITGINIFRVVDGRIVEHWGNSDDLGLMQQLGVIPAMG
jgi:predicted SnoaL-like aldol condensation-catalyzing enzyme